MKKTSVLWIILDLIFLVVFNVLFFVLGGFKHSAIVWISYSFIHFAYLMLLLTPKLVRRGKSSAVFGFSLYSLSAVYFLVEFVIGITFILASFSDIHITPLLPQLSPILRPLLAFADSSTAALLVQLSLAGVYAVILISNLIANEHTAEAEEKRQYEIAYVKDTSVKLKGLLDSISDKEAKKKVEKVYDAIYSSPVKSHPDLVQMENQILQSINGLEDAVSNGNKDTIISLANSLLSAVNERNLRLKTLNK